MSVCFNKAHNVWVARQTYNGKVFSAQTQTKVQAMREAIKILWEVHELRLKDMQDELYREEHPEPEKVMAFPVTAFP